MPWIGRKSYALIDEKSTTYKNQFNKKPKKKVWKFVVLGIFLVIFGIGSWFGFSSWRAIKNITAGSHEKTSLFKLLSNNKVEKLTGENKDRINILLIGVGGKGHPGGTLADTIMLMSIKPKEKQVAFLSIPRDFYAKLPDGSYGKINSVHSYGEMYYKKTGGGPVALSKTVAEITGQPVDYYIRGDFLGFKKIVDTLGGVTVNVDKALYDPYYPDERMVGYAPFKIKKGIQQMDGTTALKYARSRESTSDFDRARRQQQVMVAIKDKAGSLGILSNPKKIVDLINVLGDHIYTNFSLDELTRLISIAKDVDSTKIKQVVLSNASDGLLVSSSGTSAGYVLKPKTGNYLQIQQLSKDIFLDDSTKQTAQSENASVEVQNATGLSGQATEVAKVLTGYGYKADPYLQILNPVAETVLYDYSAGTKKQTAQFLTNKFNARKIEKKPVDTSTTDFVLILGTDYLDLLKTASRQRLAELSNYHPR